MFNRRDFIKTLGLTSSGLVGLGPQVFGQGKSLLNNTSGVFSPIRIKGRVASEGKGLNRVVVSDGRSVVLTNSSGDFELNSSTDRDFVFISIPSGFEIKQLPNGSADFFHRIDKSKAEQNVYFDFKKSVANDESHYFLLLSDTQIQNEYDANQLLTVSAPDVQKTVKNLNDPNLFGIGCGDLVYDRFELFKEYNQSIQMYDTPFFQVIGNHDMDFGVRSDAWSNQTFKSHFGPNYYSWNRGEVHYVVLDDVFYLGTSSKYIGYIDEEQLAWLEQDLKHVEKGKTVVVSLHIPTFTGAVNRYPNQDVLGVTVSNREHLYRILEGYQVHLLSGHTHFNDNMSQGNIYEHCHGTVCGAWWSGPICYDGTPNGYAVYQAKGSELSWQYKGTGLDFDEQFRVYPKGYHPDFPDQLSLNCWNYDPKWEISVYENGIKTGAPEKIVAKDPWSMELHTGPDLPAIRKWVEPQLNDHMFFFKPQNTSNIIIEVKDRFGKIYTKSI